jgi:ABC-type transport system involved in multi-copper enzyme maturation permease subunit
MTALHLHQIWLVARLQLTRVFFSKRSFWVYGLAFFPCIPFLGHAIQTQFTRARYEGHAVSASVLESLHEGDTDAHVLARAGSSLEDSTFRAPRDLRARRRSERTEESDVIAHRRLRYYDGQRVWNLDFEEGILKRIRSRALIDFADDRNVYAAIFQHFYLRLAIFFGCLGIFVNLFRGEMLDKTLHFWFLAPMRREVLLGGKYLAGIIAASVIFMAGAGISYGAMIWPQDPAQLAAFWQNQGLSHAFWYAASAALACLGYGSVFLAAGMLVKNPVIPAAGVLLWETINGALPAILQKFSILYYVSSLAPVPPPMDPDAPLLIRLLASPAAPPPAPLAILGLLALTAVILWASSVRVRSLEINYSTD